MAEKIDENITAVAETEAVRGGNRDAEEAGAAIRCDKEITADEGKDETAAREKKRGFFARLGEGIKNKFSALKSAGQSSRSPSATNTDRSLNYSARKSS